MKRSRARDRGGARGCRRGRVGSRRRCRPRRCPLVPGLRDAAHAPVRRSGHCRGAGGRSHRGCGRDDDQDRLRAVRDRRPRRGHPRSGRRADRGAVALAPRVPHARLPSRRDATARRLRAGEDHGSGRRQERARHRNVADRDRPLAPRPRRPSPARAAREHLPRRRPDPTDRGDDAGADPLGRRRSWSRSRRSR